jgi:endonuclease YncB( thermonuclease family)
MTKRITRAAAALALLAIAACDARADSVAVTRLGPCRALRASDGDSADLVCAGELVQVRLANVAAPRPGELGYAEATRGLAELLRARELWAASTGARDPGGRRLVELYDAHGANLNVAFVLLGWATYSADPAPSHFEKSFRAAEAEARSERRALWTVWSVAADR